MNNHYFCTFLLTVITITVYAQGPSNWTALNLTSPLGWYARSTSAVNENVVWGLLSTATESDQYFWTSDGGQSFTTGSLPFMATDAVAYDIFAIDDNVAFVTSSTNSGGHVEGLHRTKDGGQNWELVYDNAINNSFLGSVYFFDENNGFLRGGSNGNAVFFTTDDGGDTWLKSTDEFDYSSYWTRSGNDACDAYGDTIWCANVPNVIYRSTTKGRTWEAFSHGLSGRNVMDVAFKDANNGLAVSAVESDGMTADNNLVRTTNGGETWTQISIPNFFNFRAHHIEYIPGTDGAYLVTNGDSGNVQFMYTTDNGNTWTFKQAPSNLYAVDFLSPTLGFGSTTTLGGGLLKYNDNLFGTSSLDVIGSHELMIYPNPVENQISIQLGQALQGDITIRLVNIVGQIVLERNHFKNQKEEIIDLNVTRLFKGPYQLMVSNKDKTIAKSVVKQ